MFRFLGHFMRALAGGAPHPQDSPMKELDTIEAFEACLAQSAEAPLFVFKHSTRCPVSSHARSEVVTYTQQEGAAPVFINYVVEARPVSNEIASVLGVQHESPQIFLLAGGAVRWHTSHGGIRATAMAEALRTMVPDGGEKTG